VTIGETTIGQVTIGTVTNGQMTIGEVTIECSKALPITKRQVMACKLTIGQLTIRQGANGSEKYFYNIFQCLEISLALKNTLK